MADEVPIAGGSPLPPGGGGGREPAEVQEGELALDPEQACNLVSEHGGEIVIAPDGRVVFMNASEHLVELAHALDPENEDVKKRMAAIEAARAKRSKPEAPP